MNLWGTATSTARKEQMKNLEKELEWIRQVPQGTLIVCPLCNYVSKNGRGSAKVFQNGDSSALKCFSCGERRQI